jgi:hypothetical protein
MYQLTNGSSAVVRLSDGACIPADPKNADYRAYTAWLAAGNTASPAAGLTQDDYISAIEDHINDVAKAKAYSGAVSMASYVTSTVPQWAAEAQTFVAWRDACWVYAYTQLAAVQQAQRSQPTVAGFILELPTIVWP